MDRPTFDPITAFEAFRADREASTSPVYQALLDRTPVAWIPPEGIGERAKVGYWGIFGYDELIAAAKDYKTFSNVTTIQEARVLPLQADPPEHSAIRKMMNPYFTKEAVDRVEPQLHAACVEMLDALIAKGSADFSQEFAYPYPTRSLCTFLGISADNWEIHHAWVASMEQGTGQGLLDPDAILPEELVGGIIPYIKAEVDARRANPADDVISGMVHGQIAGQPVDDMMAVFLVMTLMLAGHITTTSTMGAMVTRLARDSELQARVRANPDRIPDLIDETMRMDGPQQAMPRKLLQDVEVGGQTLKAGEYVELNFGSANVDPRHWPDADRFDLDREDKRHLSFGRGLHLCIGQQLARAELALVARELLARTSSFELAGEIRRTAWPLSTVRQLPLTFTAA